MAGLERARSGLSRFVLKTGLAHFGCGGEPCSTRTPEIRFPGTGTVLSTIALSLRRHFHIENVDLFGPIAKVLLKLLGVYGRGLRNATDVRLRRLELWYPDLPRAFHDYRVLHISDLHLDGFPPLLEVLVPLVRRAEADLVVFTGDFHLRFERDWQAVLPLMRRLLGAVRTHDGILAVRGNHDPDELLPALEELGIRFLNNRSECLQRDGQTLCLAGVDDPHFYEAADLPRALRGVPKDAFLILLAHTPELYGEAARMGVRLYLCGHTHGGQIQLPRVGPLFLNIRAPRSLGAGLWRRDGMWGYTNLGAGNTAVPVRLGCRPEIVMIHLKKGSGEPVIVDVTDRE